MTRQPQGDVLLVIDRERYRQVLTMAEATVVARKATMDNAQQQRARRAKLTTTAISDEAREGRKRVLAASGCGPSHNRRANRATENQARFLGASRPLRTIS